MGEKVTFARAFRYFHRLPQVLSGTVPLTLLLGLLQMGPSFWLWVLAALAAAPMAFWLYYFLERDMNQFEAIARSYALVLNNLGSYVLFALLAFGLGLLVGVTLGIAGIWVTPFILITQGALFSKAEGLQGDYSG